MIAKENYFYKIIQAQKFDWNILKLKNASLGRIDLHYFRKFKVTDQDDQLENFMEKCCQSDPSPQSPDEVLHLINFDKIRNSIDKPGLLNAVLQGAEDIGSALDIKFINYEK